MYRGAMENWCEYLSRDGEVRNVLQFLCECEDLDETFTNLVSSNSASAAAGTPGGWSRVLAVAQDRARVPWPGGARRVDLAWFLAALLLWLLRLAARRSTTIVQVVLVVATCFGVLGYTHLMALRRRSRSQFHVAWLTLSVLGLYVRHRGSVDPLHPPVLPRTKDMVLHVCLLLMVACYGHCCLADPGRIESTTATSEEGGLAPSLPPSNGKRGDAGSGAAGGARSYSGAEFDAKPLLRDRQQEHPRQREDPRRQRQPRQQQQELHRRQERRRRLRTGRCSICRCTFRLRDHHCVWVGQCVAERNRRSFLAFLVLLAGLSLWFSRRTMALTVVGRRAPLCRGNDCDVFSAWAFARESWGLYRRCGECSISAAVLGGEDVAVGLYALVASVLSAALAIQQILLISADVTTAELRARRDPRASSSLSGEDAPRSSTGNSGSGSLRFLETRNLVVARSPTSRTVVPTPLQTAARSPTPPRGRSSSFSSFARIVAGNWAKFLMGAELPPYATAAPPPPRGSVAAVEEATAAAAAAVSATVSLVEGGGYTPTKVDAAAVAEPAARQWDDRGKMS